MTNIERWTLMGAPLGRVHVTGGPPLSSPEQPDGIGVEIEVVPASQLKGAVARTRTGACSSSTPGTSPGARTLSSS
jgi:hypothetical protein